MAETYLPIILPGDYNAFRRIVPSLPLTYDEWRASVSEQGLQFVKAGHVSKGIRIEPDEFTVWLVGHAADRSIDGLTRFAGFKGPLVDPH